MKRMKRKWPRFLAAVLVGVLTVTNIGVVPAAAADESGSEPVILRQADFEGLDLESESDTILATFGARDETNTTTTFKLSTEGDNRYAYFKHDYLGSWQKLFEINPDDTVKKEIVPGETLWITMDLRFKTGTPKLRFRTEDDSLVIDNVITLESSIKAKSGKKYPTDEWRTIVFELNQTDGKYRVYVDNNGELDLVAETSPDDGLTVTDFTKLQVRSKEAEGTWDIDNVAIYQADDYVDFEDLSPEADEPVYVASVSGTAGTENYETLQGAIDAADETISSNPDATVEIDLLTNVTSSEAIEITSSGITLDLNGKTLDMGGNFLLSNGDVVDNSTDKAGRLKIATYTQGEVEQGKESLIGTPKGKLAENNTQMPVYIAEEGYMLASMKAQATQTKAEDLSSFNSISRPSFGSAHVDKLRSGASAAKLQFILRLDWTKDGTSDYQEFSYSDELVQNVYTNSKAFSVTVNGLADYASSMKVSEYVISDLGVVLENNSFSMNEPSVE